MSTILITGGAGFIGSHTCIVLLKQGFNLIILDSLVNSSNKVINKIKKISGLKELNDKLVLIKGDIRDTNLLSKIFKDSTRNHKPIEAVIHFAGLKSVKESILNPLIYWDVNVSGSLNLLKVMEEHKCFTLIFSSSATIYGLPKNLPILENAEIKPFNIYGETKATVEKILIDIANNNKSQNWRIATLRYFNPVGAHPSGLIGEYPLGEPNNLFPYICQVGIGKIKKLKIFGNDWATHDGTGVRDYIHVMDLADAHVATLKFLKNFSKKLIHLNIGTGRGLSVLEIVKKFEEVNKISIPYSFTKKREGDIGIYYADNQNAIKTLDWKPKYNVEEMCRDSWRWQKYNPYGY